jgi:hypothetical protein
LRRIDHFIPDVLHGKAQHDSMIMYDSLQALQMPGGFKSTLAIKSSTSRILTGKNGVRVTEVPVIRICVLRIGQQVVTCDGFSRPLGEESKAQSKTEYSRSHHDLQH